MFHATRKPVKLAESKLGPLIEASFERHQPVQVDDDDGAGHVEEDDGQQPEDDVRRAKSSRRANPAEPHDVEDLREHEIAQAELFLEGSAAAVDSASARSMALVMSSVGSGPNGGRRARRQRSRSQTEERSQRRAKRRRGTHWRGVETARAPAEGGRWRGGGSGSQATSGSVCLRSRTSTPACRATRGASRLLVPVAIRTSPFRLR